MDDGKGVSDGEGVGDGEGVDDGEGANEGIRSIQIINHLITLHDHIW